MVHEDVPKLQKSWRQQHGATITALHRQKEMIQHLPKFHTRPPRGFPNYCSIGVKFHRCICAFHYHNKEMEARTSSEALRLWSRGRGSTAECVHSKETTQCQGETAWNCGREKSRGERNYRMEGIKNKIHNLCSCLTLRGNRLSSSRMNNPTSERVLWCVWLRAGFAAFLSFRKVKLFFTCAFGNLETKEIIAVQIEKRRLCSKLYLPFKRSYWAFLEKKKQVKIFLVGEGWGIRGYLNKVMSRVWVVS